MLLFIFLTIASLLILIMGFMGIRIPFPAHVADGFSFHSKPVSQPPKQGIQVKNRMITDQTFRNAPNHHTVEANRGIFSKPPAETALIDETG